MREADTKNTDIKEIKSVISQLGISQPEYIASVLVSNGIGIKDLSCNVEEMKKIEHGFWHSVHHYRDKAHGICSVCHKGGQLRVTRDDWGVWYIDSPYCPACGSIMDGKINYA